MHHVELKACSPDPQVPVHQLAFPEPAMQAQGKELVFKAHLVEEPMLSFSFGAATGEIQGCLDTGLQKLITRYQLGTNRETKNLITVHANN